MLLSARVSQAQLDLSLIQDTFTVSNAQDSTLLLQANLTNNNPDPLYLNSDTTFVDAPLTMDDTPFFTTFVNPTPPTLRLILAGNGGATTQTLFTVFVPAGTADGVYAGEFTLFGGIDPTALDIQGGAQFQVTVFTPSQQPPDVPEPGNLALLIGGMTGGIGLLCQTSHRIRRKSSKC